MTGLARGLAAFSLDGKKALITGGNRGLGFAFTQALADCGASVTFIGRGEEANEAAVRRLADLGVRAHGIAADLSKDDDVRRGVDEAAEALGGLDIVVNNAGACFHNPAWDATDEQWQQVFDLNVRAAGKSVAILGGGPIGMLLMTAARAAGAERIAVTDLQRSKRERATKLGADAAVDGAAADAVERVGHALGGPADVVFDAVARRASMAQAIALVTKGGEIVVVGVGAPGETPVRLDLIQDREVVVRGSLMFVAQDFTTSLRLLTGGAVRANDLVTSVFDGLDAAADAFRASTDPQECKVLVRL